MPGPIFWGLCSVYDIMFAFALPGAVPVVGGLRTPRYCGPLGRLPREQGGPWAPPLCGDNSSETLSDW